eukprot:gene21040-25248_t
MCVKTEELVVIPTKASTARNLQNQPASGMSLRAPRIDSKQLQSRLMAMVSDVLGSGIGVNEPLMDAGLDSLGAVEFRKTIENDIGVDLPATVAFDYPSVATLAGAVERSVGLELPVTAAFDYPSVAALAAYLQSQLPHADDDTESLMESLTHDAPLHLVPSLTVHATSCSFCGGDFDISLNHDGIVAVPGSRWDLDVMREQDPRTLPAAFGGFLDAIESFDEKLFLIPPAEAMLMDPQQRLLCHTMVDLLLSARHTVEQPPPIMGVYLGICIADYTKIVVTSTASISAYSGPGSALSVASGRLSYMYGAQGPSVSVDTACSSSLVAAHLARTVHTSSPPISAAVCGVNLTLDAYTSATFACAGMLAVDGRCKTLDALADGYVRGESCAAIFMCSNQDEDDEASTSCAHLAGSAVNQDGRSSSLTAPNGPSQQVVIRQSLENASSQPKAVSLLQLHGTGTGLGDPIEMGAAAAVLLKGAAWASPKPPLSLAAVKSSIGHAEASA